MKNKLYWNYAASCALLLFVFLGYVVKFYPQQLAFIDKPFTSLIRENITPTKTTFFLWITKFGNPITIILVTLVIILICWRRKFYLEMGWLILNVALFAGIVNALLKLLFARPRPDLIHMVTEKSFSFPSGHSVGSLLCYGTILLLIPRLITNKKVRIIIQVLLGLFILTIGVSRIYAGVHYPTDILGGFLLGTAWLSFSYPHYLELRTKLIFQKKQR